MNVVAAGLVAMRRRVARAFARPLHARVPRPQHLRRVDQHERHRQQYPRRGDGELAGRLAALRLPSAASTG